MESSDCVGMFAQSCGAMGIKVIKATIEDDITGMRCFTWKTFGMGMVIGYYKDTMMDINLCDGKDADKRYGEGLM